MACKHFCFSHAVTRRDLYIIDKSVRIAISLFYSTICATDAAPPTYRIQFHTLSHGALPSLPLHGTAHVWLNTNFKCLRRKLMKPTALHKELAEPVAKRCPKITTHGQQKSNMTKPKEPHPAQTPKYGSKIKRHYT